jgi:hypothetical protein
MRAAEAIFLTTLLLMDLESSAEHIVGSPATLLGFLFKGFSCDHLNEHSCSFVTN